MTTHTAIASRTLPASRNLVPARLTLGKVKRTKVYSGMYEYVLEVKIDGKRVGDAVDEGNGGGIWFRADSAEGRVLEEQVQAEYAALRPDIVEAKDERVRWYYEGSSHETLYNVLVENADAERDLNRLAAKQTHCLKGLDTLVTVEGSDGFYTETLGWLVLRGMPRADALSPVGSARLKADGITHVWDGKEWRAL